MMGETGGQWPFLAGEESIQKDGRQECRSGGVTSRLEADGR